MYSAIILKIKQSKKKIENIVKLVSIFLYKVLHFNDSK